MTPIADMVEQMLARNTPMDVILLAIRSAERYAVTLRVTPTVTLSDTPGAVRARRFRQNHKQNQGPAEANDAARNIPDEALRVTPAVTQGCDLSSLPSEGIQGKKESKRGSARARGTRLSPDARPSDADRQFAVKHGVDPDAAWAEFVDFWIGVPGRRGEKLDWPATWRNRVRDVAGRRRGGRNAATINTPNDGIRQLREDAERRSHGAARLGSGGDHVRLLPPGRGE